LTRNLPRYGQSSATPILPPLIQTHQHERHLAGTIQPLYNRNPSACLVHYLNWLPQEVGVKWTRNSLRYAQDNNQPISTHSNTAEAVATGEETDAGVDDSSRESRQLESPLPSSLATWDPSTPELSTLDPSSF
jgi:hypothetical protein